MKNHVDFVAAFLVAMLSVLCAEDANGQNTNKALPTQFIGIGSTNAVYASELASVNFYWLLIRQIDASGNYHTYLTCSTNRSFSSQQELEDYNTSCINQLAPGILTNQSPNINWGLPFYAYGLAQSGPRIFLYCNFPFYVGTTNGQHYLTNFPDTVKMGLNPGLIGLRVPGIKSAIMEGFISNAWQVITDSRTTGSNPWGSQSAGGGVDAASQFLVVPSWSVVGNFPLRLSVVCGSNNDFTVVEQSGFKTNETAITVSRPTRTGQTVTVHASGGDPGRSWVFQRSTNLTTWVDVAGVHTVGTIGNDQGMNCSDSIASPTAKAYFRVRTVNTAF